MDIFSPNLPQLRHGFISGLLRDRKMSLIQMSSVEEAIQALMDLHNYDMGGNHHLKVSFSKSTI